MIASEAAGSLRRLDDRPLDHSPDSVVACVVLRNEFDRLRPLLDHHRRLGIDRFFMVDNDSDDGSVEFLREQPDVHLWSTTDSFRRANYGALWFEAILRDHAPTNWVVIVDADELLWYESCETRMIADLCAELESSNFRAMSGALLDMYPEGPLADHRPSGDRSPLLSAKWFDRRWCHGVVGRSGPNHEQVGLFGGVRRRLFGGDGWDYCLSKVPLVKFGPDVVLVGGQHWTHLPLSTDRAAVLHFKLDARLVDLAWEELDRGQRETHVQEYHAYAEKLALHPALAAFDPDESLEFAGSSQLRELGILGPIADPEEARRHISALMTQAEIRVSQGEIARAKALLERAVEVGPTAVGPLLRLAALHRSAGESTAAASAFSIANARKPDDLEILSIQFESVRSHPSWADRLRHHLRSNGHGVTVVADLGAEFSVTEISGITPPHLDSPWIGFTNAVVDQMTSITPFAHRSLQAFWDAPAFQASLPHCRALFTFTEYAANWLRQRTDVPVLVVPHPIDSTSTGFDLERFLRTYHRTVVQPGLWFTDLNAILDLRLVDRCGSRGVQKIRCVPKQLLPLANAIARVQRHSTRDRVSLEALCDTTELGGVTDGEIARMAQNSVVLASLIDANADPTMLGCLASATPMLVPKLPGTVEHLGDDYPLFIESLDHAAELLCDEPAIAAAHARMIDARGSHRVARFLEAVDTAVAGAVSP